MKKPPPLIRVSIDIGAADAGDPRIAALLRSILGAVAPLVSTADLEELQAALETALLDKRIDQPATQAPPRKR